jgi:hypothetical protein
MQTKRFRYAALAAVLATVVAAPPGGAMTRTTDSSTHTMLTISIGGSEAAGGFKEPA